MTVTSGSRYTTTPIVTLYGPDGLARQVLTGNPQESVTFTYTTYEIVGEDRIDNLARAFYGDSTQWWAFANANPEILDWSSLTPGTLIRVPNLPYSSG